MVYGSSLTLPADLITPSERIEHNAFDYSHRLKAHMQNVCPIITRHHMATDKHYHRDLTLDTCSKIFLKKVNKTGLQDNYLGPFDVIARSEKYFTIRLNNGKIDNVAVERVKPCFSQANALPRPALEQEHEVHPSAPPAPPAYQGPQPPPAPPAGEEPYRTRYGRISRKPHRFMFHVYKDIDFFTKKPAGKGGDVAHAT